MKSIFTRLCFTFFTLLIFSSCSSLGLTKDCEVTENKITDSNFEVSVLKYAMNQVATKSLIIIPPTGGTNFIDRSYAKQFCHAHYDVYILNGWTRDQETTFELAIHERFYSNAQTAVRIVLDHIQTKSIGLLGTSVGALHASVAASLHPRINAVFAILGGTPIADVIVTSDQPAMVDLRNARKKMYGFTTDEQQRTAIDQVLSKEPYKLGLGFKNKALGLVIAEQDQTVATATQYQLKKFWQPQKVITISTDHFWGIVRTWLFHSNEILDFFEKNQPKS